MSPRFPIPSLLLGALLLSGCGGREDLSPVHVDVIGSRKAIEKPLAHAATDAGSVMLGATGQGLLSLDASGNIVDGLAGRWVVEDDGKSFIFRLKRTHWPDGDPVKAEEAAKLLRRRLADARPLLGGLTPTVKVMTDEVIEVDLDAPMPLFLQLLAQPALGVARRAGGTGPLSSVPGDGGFILHSPRASVDVESEDDPETDGEQAQVHVRANRAALAIARFKAGHADLVLGGRFQHLPLLAAASIGDKVVRADPVNGLFGLLVEGNSDFLADPYVREALSMAIDRARLSALLNVSGWQSRQTLLPEPLDIGRAPTAVTWTAQDFSLRRSYARSVVANWIATRGGPLPPLRIALPAGPGADTLYGQLARNFAAIGLSAQRAEADGGSDLRLIDEVAPFDSALWYINRVGCAFTTACSVNADMRLKLAREAHNDTERAIALGEAETQAVANTAFLPLGQPIRFSLVRARLTGYAPSPRGYHPLDKLFKSANR